jgi:hypothetical protein
MRGRILMARGRDAVDVPISNTFGPNTLVSFQVVTEEVAQYAYRQGLYVLAQSGETVVILNDEQFQPSFWCLEFSRHSACLWKSFPTSPSRPL